MMILTLDNLAHRYNVLPSEALQRASTFDLHVLDISAKWNKYQNDLADGKIKKQVPTVSAEQMVQMIASVKESTKHDKIYPNTK